ncbi:uncharacterized protein Dana_GF26283 [Drosophila ananassae]|uniref:Uncharacterized protein n=1 Tax=Drosophila ananassae TaxID=7217 RepID=A0A0P8YBJ1_DROAN|nr:uncharacterized protein Dana_GF26283 [Drosophila ananassae]
MHNFIIGSAQSRSRPLILSSLDSRIPGCNCSSFPFSFAKRQWQSEQHSGAGISNFNGQAIIIAFPWRIDGDYLV